MLGGAYLSGETAVEPVLQLAQAGDGETSRRQAPLTWDSPKAEPRVLPVPGGGLQTEGQAPLAPSAVAKPLTPVTPINSLLPGGTPLTPVVPLAPVSPSLDGGRHGAAAPGLTVVEPQPEGGSRLPAATNGAPGDLRLQMREYGNRSGEAQRGSDDRGSSLSGDVRWLDADERNSFREALRERHKRSRH